MFDVIHSLRESTKMIPMRLEDLYIQIWATTISPTQRRKRRCQGQFNGPRSHPSGAQIRSVPLSSSPRVTATLSSSPRVTRLCAT